MKIFYDNIKEIILFLVIVLIFTMATNEKTTQMMILLVMLGAVLLNADTIISFLKKF